MWRGLLLLLGLLTVTWFEFEVYPGHSYLQGETQILVPMLERLDTPGFLSRDLVATNPTFAYTIYDEVTQALHTGARIGFEKSLSIQQLPLRFAAILGLFLLARAWRVKAWPALFISGVVNAMTHLAGPEAFVTNPEATPASFALPLVFLAAGLMANANPLLGGLAGGLALLYDPVTAVGFWLVLAAVWLSDRSLRQRIRPAWPAFFIFALILGNLVQWQAGLGAGMELTARMSAELIQLTQIRTPWVWVSGWAWPGLLNYLFWMVAGVWAAARMWKLAGGLAKWMTLGLALSGFVSTASAVILLAQHAQWAVSNAPARNLALSVALPALLCGAVGRHAAQAGKRFESFLWLSLLLAGVLNAQVLDLLHGRIDVVRRNRPDPSVQLLAQWAEETTWGSSLFQFPDAGKQNAPGEFRALSKRALWADWQSGVIADDSEQAGLEWWARWQATMTNGYSPQRWDTMLRLPIDYYVLTRAHLLKGRKPVYTNAKYFVYDAQDLREAAGHLESSY